MKGKIIKISLFCIVIALAIFSIFQIIKNETINIKVSETELQALSSTSVGTLAPGEKNPDTYDYHIDTGIW